VFLISEGWAGEIHKKPKVNWQCHPYLRFQNLTARVKYSTHDVTQMGYSFLEKVQAKLVLGFVEKVQPIGKTHIKMLWITRKSFEKLHALPYFIILKLALRRGYSQRVYKWYKVSIL
jgi:hypothetical protein